MEQLGIEIHLNTEVGDLSQFAGQDIVIATGSAARVLNHVPGHERMIEACDYLTGTPVGQTVAVIGGGLTGSEIAYELALQGKQPILVEMKDDLVSQKGVCLANSSYLREWFALHQVPVYLETTLKAVKDGALSARARREKKRVAAASVISSPDMYPHPWRRKAGVYGW